MEPIYQILIVVAIFAFLLLFYFSACGFINYYFKKTKYFSGNGYLRKVEGESVTGEIALYKLTKSEKVINIFHSISKHKNKISFQDEEIEKFIRENQDWIKRQVKDWAFCLVSYNNENEFFVLRIRAEENEIKQYQTPLNSTIYWIMGDGTKINHFFILPKKILLS